MSKCFATQDILPHRTFELIVPCGILGQCGFLDSSLLSTSPESLLIEN